MQTDDLFNTSSNDFLIAGVDEVGRGPLAGDVVTAAVILPREHTILGITDSKKLSPKKRDRLFIEIQEQAIAWAIGRCSIAEIDELNILHASMLAMKRAVEKLAIQPNKVLVDGNRLPNWGYEAQAIIGGDASEECIGAASILAKVTRDREMEVWAKQYPEYGFEKHKGYPTALHMDMLQKHGVTPIHRRSFGPVKRLLEQMA